MLPLLCSLTVCWNDGVIGMVAEDKWKDDGRCCVGMHCGMLVWFPLPSC